MASFNRRLKRRQMVTARKEFMKHFKKTMKQFKKQVVCSVCSRAPREMENIDNWHIDKNSENINLICVECHSERQSEAIDDV